jgi:hypothetical protein
MNVWKSYSKSCKALNKSVPYSKFVDLWNNLFPNVVIAKPMTDLCAECQENTTKIQRSATYPTKKNVLASSCINSI